MADAQKSYCNPSCEVDGEKVLKPDTFDDSNSDSDSFGLKVQMLTRVGDAGQSSSKQNCDDSNKQLWFVETDLQDNFAQKAQEVILDSSKGVLDSTKADDIMEMEMTRSKDSTVNITATHTLSLQRSSYLMII